MLRALLGSLLLIATACGSPLGGRLGDLGDDGEPAGLPGSADRVYRGGPIVTLDPANQVAEALAIRDGRIVAVGSEADVLGLQGPETRIVDLAGHALLPGFIDAHGHLTLAARYQAMLNVAPPPVGPVSSIGELQQVLRSHLEEREPPPGSWIVAAGYDDALLAEERHPTRFDLDAVSTEHPIAALHVSGHLATANSAALAAAGVTADTPDPKSGVFRRVAGSSEPNGVMEESGVFVLLGHAPQPTGAEMIAHLGAAQVLYASNGFTTAQDGGTDAGSFELLKAAQDAGALYLDVIAYGIWNDFEQVVAAARKPIGEYDGHLKLGGGKILLDGSPQGKTAWLSEPYHVPPEGQDEDYAGYPWLDDESVYSFAARLRAEHWPILAHANGDAAAEQWIRTVERLRQQEGASDWRPVMIHAQALRRDQLPRVAKQGMIPSFFVAHTFYWGDWHRDSVFGPERAAAISPTASALANGVKFTIHNDAPVVPPKGAFLLWTATNRITRSGQVLGPEERLTPEQALRALTIDAAYQAFEENEKGSLEPGKLADLVILSANPMDIEPAAIRDIEVLETIKAGKTVWREDD